MNFFCLPSLLTTPATPSCDCDATNWVVLSGCCDNIKGLLSTVASSLPTLPTLTGLRTGLATCSALNVSCSWSVSGTPELSTISDSTIISSEQHLTLSRLQAGAAAWNAAKVAWLVVTLQRSRSTQGHRSLIRDTMLSPWINVIFINIITLSTALLRIIVDTSSTVDFK